MDELLVLVIRIIASLLDREPTIHSYPDSAGSRLFMDPTPLLWQHQLGMWHLGDRWLFYSNDILGATLFFVTHLQIIS